MGELMIGSYDNQLCLCDWRYRKKRAEIDQRIMRILNTEYEEQKDAVIEKTIQQLNEYFSGERTQFDISLLLVGSDFQQKVWNTLLQIPYGKTSSYLALSAMLENTKAIRAVAAANGANAISIIVPCHRIIGSNGELVGYAGGLKAKQLLLELEQNYSHQMSLF